MKYEIFLTGMGILLILTTWKFVWLPTALDKCRDQLFDIRDKKLQRFFEDNNYGVEHPMYVELRNLLNGHLRHTESVDIWEMMHLIHQLEKNPDLGTYEKQRYNNRFHTDDKNLKIFIEEIRVRSTSCVLQYLINKSVIAFFMSIISKVQESIKQVSTTSSKLLRGAFSTLPDSSSRLAMELAALD